MPILPQSFPFNPCYKYYLPVGQDDRLKFNLPVHHDRDNVRSCRI